MTADLKIRMHKDPQTGEDCIEPTLLKALLENGKHRKTCLHCSIALAAEDGSALCNEGIRLLGIITEHPDVQVINVKP